MSSLLVYRVPSLADARTDNFGGLLVNGLDSGQVSSVLLFLCEQSSVWAVYRISYSTEQSGIGQASGIFRQGELSQTRAWSHLRGTCVGDLVWFDSFVCSFGLAVSLDRPFLISSFVLGSLVRGLRA